MKNMIKSQNTFFNNGYITTTLLCFILGYLVVQAYNYFCYAYKMASFPYAVDSGEGLVLHRVMSLLRGENIYTSIYHEPYTVMNYPPLFELFLSGVARIFNVKLFLGRLISIFAAIISVYFIGSIVFRLTGRKEVSAVAGLLFLSSGWVQSWSVLCRNDMFAVLLTLTGLSLFIDHEKDNQARYLLLSILCFIGALFTRQSAISAPLACTLFLFMRYYIPTYFSKHRTAIGKRLSDFNIGLRFLMGFLGISFLIIGFLSVVTNGEFLRHITIYTASSFSWEKCVFWLKRFLHAHGITVFLSMVFVVFSFVNKRLYVFLLFWILALLVTTLAGKTGSAINYFLEFWAANCILAGLILGVVLDEPASKMKYFILQFVVIACIIAQLFIFYRLNDSVTPSDEDRASSEYISQLIRNSTGEILSEYSGYMAQNGKEIIFQPFSMTQLTKRGLWDQNRILNDIRQNRFSLIIMSKAGLYFKRRWTQEMIDAVAENYRHIDTVKCFELSSFVHSVSELNIFMPREEVQE